MDTITHCLTGALLASALRQPVNRPEADREEQNNRPRLSRELLQADLLPAAPAQPTNPNRGLPALMVLASNLPDIDAVLNVLPHGFILRRTATHSLLMLPLVALVGAWLARWITPQYCFSHRFALVGGASLLHILMDLPNSFGVALLWPLTTRRFELASVFVVDLVYWGVLVGALVLPWMFRNWLGRWRVRIAWGSLGLLLAYTIGCSAARSLAYRALAAAVGPGESAYVFHEPFGPALWRGVVREADGDYRVYALRTWPIIMGDAENAVQLRQEHANDSGTSVVQRILAADRGARQVESFFRSPIWKAGETTATLRDLRFSSLNLPGRSPFVFEFKDPLKE